MHQIGESRTKKPQQQLNTSKTATEHYHRVGQHRTAAHRRWGDFVVSFFAAVLIPLALAGVSYA